MIFNTKVDKLQKELIDFGILILIYFTLVPPKIKADRTQQVKHFQLAP